MKAEFISVLQADRKQMGMEEYRNELKLRIRKSIPMWIDIHAIIEQLESEKSTLSA